MPGSRFRESALREECRLAPDSLHILRLQEGNSKDSKCHHKADGAASRSFCTFNPSLTLISPPTLPSCLMRKNSTNSTMQRGARKT